jgi:hypothetical protein
MNEIGKGVWRNCIIQPLNQAIYQMAQDPAPTLWCQLHDLQEASNLLRSNATLEVGCSGNPLRKNFDK